jgi:hypothetical protein
MKALFMAKSKSEPEPGAAGESHFCPHNHHSVATVRSATSPKSKPWAGIAQQEMSVAMYTHTHHLAFDRWVSGASASLLGPPSSLNTFFLTNVRVHACVCVW